MPHKLHGRGRRERYNRNSAYQDWQPSLGNLGVSVFRGVPLEEVSPSLTAFERLTRGQTRRIRGRFIDLEPALGLLELEEVKRQRQFIGHVAIQDAIDELYHKIPSLRQPMLNLKVASVGIVGFSDYSSPSVGLTFDQPSRQVIWAERAKILETLESFGVGADEGDYDWDHKDSPHVPLGRISPSDMPKVQYDNLLEGLEVEAPTSLDLQRATLHNPSTSHSQSH